MNGQDARRELSADLRQTIVSGLARALVEKWSRERSARVDEGDVVSAAEVKEFRQAAGTPPGARLE